MPWVDEYVPGTPLCPGKLQCCICFAVTKDDYMGMKDAKRIAGAHFSGKNGGSTHGTVRCPRCHKTKNQRHMQGFNTYWVLALPMPWPAPMRRHQESARSPRALSSSSSWAPSENERASRSELSPPRAQIRQEAHPQSCP